MDLMSANDFPGNLPGKIGGIQAGRQFHFASGIVVLLYRDKSIRTVRDPGCRFNPYRTTLPFPNRGNERISFPDGIIEFVFPPEFDEGRRVIRRSAAET